MEWIKKNTWQVTFLILLLGWPYLLSLFNNTSERDKPKHEVEVIQEPIDLAFIVEKQEEKIKELEAANLQLERAIVAAVTKSPTIKKKPTLTDTIIWQLQKKYSR